jgi:hypothetical protein
MGTFIDAVLYVADRRVDGDYAWDKARVSDKTNLVGAEKIVVPGFGYFLTTASEHALTPQDRASIEVGASEIVLQGVIVYLDIFNIERRSYFCFYFDSSSPKTVGWLCHKHNGGT